MPVELLGSEDDSAPPGQCRRLQSQSGGQALVPGTAIETGRSGVGSNKTVEAVKNNTATVLSGPCGLESKDAATVPVWEKITYASCRTFTCTCVLRQRSLIQDCGHHTPQDGLKNAD
jgi:hypothetical protein